MKNQDELKGKSEALKGKAKQAWGDLTDDERLRNEGVQDEAAGDSKRLSGVVGAKSERRLKTWARTSSARYRRVLLRHCLTAEG